MKTFLKILAGLLLFIIVVLVGLNLYFTDERLKNTIMPYVDESVGRPVQVESMSLTFFKTFPQPGLSIGGLHIPGDTPSDTLLSLDEFIASVELFSLFSNQINVTEVRLQNPRFTYRVYEDSTTNIDFLMEGETDTTTEASSYELNIPQFTVSRGHFGYEDATSGTSVRMNDLNANIALRYANLINSSMEIELGGLTAQIDSSRYINNLPLSLSQTSTIDMENETVSVESGTFSIRGLALNLTGSIKNWSADAPAVDLQFSSSSDNFGELLRLVPEEYQNQLEGLETRGSLSISGNLSGTMGGETLPTFSADIAVTDGYLKNPDLPQPVQNIQIKASAGNELVTIETLEATAGTNANGEQNRFSAQGQIQQPLDEQNRTIDLTTDLFFDLSTIKSFYPIDEDTLELRGQLTANATLKGDAGEIERAVQSGSINLDNGYIAYQRIGQPLEDITLNSSLQGNLLSISTASFRSGKNDLNLSGSVTDYLSENPLVDLRVEGNAQFAEIQNYYDLQPAISELTGSGQLNLLVQGPIQQPLNLEFNGRAVVQNFNMSGDSLSQPVRNLNGELNLSPASVDLTNLNFQLGSSDLTLGGSLQNYMEYLKSAEDRSVTPGLTGSFKSNTFNMDELIDWEDTTSSPIPIELPDLNSSVTASIGTLIVTGVTMTNLQAEAGTSPTQIKLDQASIEMFDGEASGAFVWDVPQPDRTNLNFKGQLEGLNVDAFFREYQLLGEKSNFHEHVTGSFSANVDYYSELDVYLTPDISTTEMNGTFSMTKSRIQGHPLQEQLATLLQADELRNIALDESNTKFTISNSILTIQDLRLTSGDIGAEMSGTQHLVNQKIDYQLKVYLPSRFRKGIASVISTQAVDALTQDNGTILLPLRVTGTQNSPNIRPDQEVIKPILQDILKKKAGDVLKNIFGN